jgi:hypothetical protein
MSWRPMLRHFRKVAPLHILSGVAVIPPAMSTTLLTNDIGVAEPDNQHNAPAFTALRKWADGIVSL